NDTHGMTGEFARGFDGWIYCCHGFSNTSTVKSKGDSAITMSSGNTYRVKADGSRIEYVTHGQVNPFGLSFDPLGNLYSCDCHTEPIYQLLRGAYYPSFGKPDDGLGFGPEMFSNYRDSTAIAGIAYYAAANFPAAYQGSAFVGPDARGTPAPRTDWTTASIEDLVQDLGHPNLTVRIKATNQLVERGGRAGVEAVRKALAAAGQDEPGAWRRMHGLWVLER